MADDGDEGGEGVEPPEPTSNPPPRCAAPAASEVEAGEGHGGSVDDVCRRLGVVCEVVVITTTATIFTVT